MKGSWQEKDFKLGKDFGLWRKQAVKLFNQRLDSMGEHRLRKLSGV
jgi:hypothetical protein